MAATSEDVTVEISGHVATVEIHRPPDNYFDGTLLGELADVYEALDDDESCRAIVLCAEGRHFCAGARLRSTDGVLPATATYAHAARLFSAGTPVVAAVHGAAVGGGLGLACSADFRVACTEARFSANFSRLGFHHGFGLTVTLPAIVGQQRALELLYTGRRIGGDEAFAAGLCDRLVAREAVRDEARALAGDIAASGPLAVRSIRETMRGTLPDRVRRALEHERSEQERLVQTEDWKEGLAAAAERRLPRFVGR